MRNLRAIIAASIATLTIFLSGCGTLRILFNPETIKLVSDREAMENIRNLQEISENVQGRGGYYDNPLFPDTPEYREYIYSLSPEQLEQEIINQYLKRAKSKE